MTVGLPYDVLEKPGVRFRRIGCCSAFVSLAT